MYKVYILFCFIQVYYKRHLQLLSGVISLISLRLFFSVEEKTYIIPLWMKFLLQHGVN